MEDGGRSAHARAAKKKKRAAAAKNDAGTSPLREQPRHPVPFAQQIPGITDALRARLAEIGATEPSFMIGKSLVLSDVTRNQARLLLSCKGGRSLPQVAGVITGTEMPFVKDKTDKTGGLLVAAFDRAGRRYDLVCKYLDSNEGYRFITGWKRYVEANGLGVETLVELWWFRSRKLHNRNELEVRRNREGKESKVAVPVTVDSGHPDGSLGLVLLHYENDALEPEQAAADEPDETLPVQETGHMESKTTTTAEDKLGTCAEPIKSKTTTIAEGKLAHDPISTVEVFSAAMGLMKLRKYLSSGGGRRRDGDDGGGGQGQGESES